MDLLTKDLHVTKPNQCFCALFFLMSWSFNTNQSHIPGRNVLPRSEALSCRSLYHKQLKKCLTSQLCKQHLLNKQDILFVWLDLWDYTLGVASPSPSSAPAPLSLCKFSMLTLFWVPPLTISEMSLAIPIVSNPTLLFYMFSPCLSPEIQACVSNFSNSSPCVHLIFIQNRPLNSPSLPQSFPFLWMTLQSPLDVQDRISLLLVVFSASFYLPLWSILSANPCKSFPKWCVITNHFSLSHPFPKPYSHLMYPIPRAS